MSLSPQAPKWLLKVVILGVLLWSGSAASAPVVTETEKKIPCAVMDGTTGEVQVLSPDKVASVDAKEKTAVECGGWVSVKAGSANLKHRQGFRIRLGSDTIVRIYDNIRDRKLTGEDHVVLLKGKAYVEVDKGGYEMSLSTANGRVRIPWGSFMALYSEWDDETQLLVFENHASLENRFEQSRTVSVQSGESSSLNLKAMRIVPTAPAAIKVAVLKERIEGLNLDRTAYDRVIESASRRAGRIVASDETKGRGLASVKPKGKSDYTRHRTTKKDADAQREFMKRMTGGMDVGSAMVFPEEPVQRRPGARTGGVVRVQQLGVNRAETLEKKRLIEELSKIKVE